MELPLSITRAGAEQVAVSGFTKNISSSGVLFVSGAAPDTGGPIEYVISLNSEGPQKVNLRCVGKVLRAQRTSGDGRRAFQVAATLERYEFIRDRERERELAAAVPKLG
jgi:hypothetical protein